MILSVSITLFCTGHKIQDYHILSVWLSLEGIYYAITSNEKVAICYMLTLVQMP